MFSSGYSISKSWHWTRARAARENVGLARMRLGACTGQQRRLRFVCVDVSFAKRTRLHHMQATIHSFIHSFTHDTRQPWRLRDNRAILLAIRAYATAIAILSMQTGIPQTRRNYFRKMFQSPAYREHGSANRSRLSRGNARSEKYGGGWIRPLEAV